MSIDKASNSARKICVVTGGGGALGSAVARRLVEDGYRVALFGTERGREDLSGLASELGADHAIFAAGSFDTTETFQAALTSVARTFGQAPTRAVLTAGGYAGGAPLHESTDDDTYERMMRVNVDTTYHALRALLPDMVRARSGSVVVIGSRAVERPWTSRNAAAYGAAKSAVVTMAEAVAAEVREHGVRINAVLPSTLDTPANRSAMPDADPSRWVSLASAASVIAFLLSEEAKDISGARIPLYGRA